MATVLKLTEDFLTCPICTEGFQDPCTLQCEHTFCRSCLRSKIEAQPQVVKSESLLCPFCRRSTPVSGVDGPLEEWITSLKQSRMIEGLMDAVSKTGEIEDCTICRDEGNTIQAMVWCLECDSALCESCLKMHQRMPALRTHKVTENLSEATLYPRKQKFVCQEHDKKIKMFCKDCTQTLCTMCCSLNHRMCKDVVPTQSMLPLVTQAMQANQLLYRERIQEISAYITKLKIMIEDKEDNCNTIKHNIDLAIVKLVKMLLEKKKQLITDVDEELHKHRDELKAKVKLGEMDIQICQQKAEFIAQALEHKSEADLYELCQEQELSGDESDDDLEKELPVHHDLQFKHELHKIEKLISEMTVSTTAAAVAAAAAAADDDRCIDLGISPKSMVTINCIVHGDKSNPLLRDVMAVRVNGVDVVVVTDWNNVSIRSFDRDNNATVLNCKTGPWSLALLTPQHAVATVPGAKQIIAFYIKPELIPTSTITTRKCYYGLDVLSPLNLVVSSPYSRPPSVDIVNMTGNVVKTFTDSGFVRDLLKSPYFVHVTSKGNILISDSGQESLSCITPEGREVFTYKPTGESRLNDPRGITTTANGDILLADFVRNVIVQLSEAGQFVRDIPISKNKLEYVWGVHLKGKELYVASSTNGVMVFKY